MASLTRSLLLGLLDPDVSDNLEKWCDFAPKPVSFELWGVDRNSSCVACVCGEQ
jgi:hypothetical protein